MLPCPKYVKIPFSHGIESVIPLPLVTSAKVLFDIHAFFFLNQEMDYLIFTSFIH